METTVTIKLTPNELDTLRLALETASKFFADSGRALDDPAERRKMRELDAQAQLLRTKL